MENARRGHLNVTSLKGITINSVSKFRYNIKKMTYNQQKYAKKQNNLSSKKHFIFQLVIGVKELFFTPTEAFIQIFATALTQPLAILLAETLDGLGKNNIFSNDISKIKTVPLVICKI